MVRAWRCRSWRAYLENRSAFGSFPLPECCGNRASSYGFNRGKMEDQRRDAAGKEAVTRRATDALVLEDAERLIAARNERRGSNGHALMSAFGTKRTLLQVDPRQGFDGCVKLLMPL
jgi:hypothetical protein